MSGAKPKVKPPTYTVKRNDRGGVLLTEAEIDAAFDFFDVKGAKELNAQDLRDRLGLFIPGLTMRECKLLVSSADGAFTKDKLRELLMDNELTEFDPIKEAFKAFDPDGVGYVTPEQLKKMMAQIGYLNLTDDDMEVLIDSADVDKDGLISIDDFANMLEFKWQPPSLLPGVDAAAASAAVAESQAKK